ncbi:MAG: SRPBCC family protein [Thermoplasmata archaeon]
MDEPLDPILLQVTVPLPIPMIFAAFVDPEKVRGWLADRAEIVPEVGGRYLLEWKEDPTFVSRGSIRALTADLDLDFSWEAPPPFTDLLRSSPSPSHVYVRLQESPEGIDVTLEHDGWGAGEAWEEARSWHFHFWDERLRRLKEYLIRSAYG